MPNYRRRRWRDAMTVRVDLNGVIAPRIGNGLTPDAVAGLDAQLAKARERVATWRSEGRLGAATSAELAGAVRPILEQAAAVRDRVDTVVVLGVGSSASAGAALGAALASEGPGARIRVVEAIDPDGIRRLLGGLDLGRTLFNVVSKSGDTAETLALFLIVRDRLMRELGAVAYKERLVVTTAASGGSLRQIVNDEGFPALVVPDAVPGHLAALTAVGMLPAAVAGIDVHELLAGAALVDECSRTADVPTRDPAAALAGVLWLLAGRGVRFLTLLPFVERLEPLARLLCQTWALALGKRGAPTAPPIPVPIPGRGTADQHAALQLYLDGAPDAAAMFIRLGEREDGIDVPSGYHDLEDVRCLGGNALGALATGAERAAEVAWARRHRPSLAFVVPAVNAFTVGQVIHLWQLATLTMAALAGIDPFVQPAVDEAKALLYGVAGRPGFERDRAAIDAWVAEADPRWLV